MIQLTLPQTTPLIQEADGAVRITGSRVTLDSMIGAFQKGATVARQLRDRDSKLSPHRSAPARAKGSYPESARSETELRSSGDPALLAWAAEHQRVVVTHDVNTIPRYAYERIRMGEPVTGIGIVPVTRQATSRRPWLFGRTHQRNIDTGRWRAYISPPS